MDKGEGGGCRKWIKNIHNIINIYFAIVDEGPFFVDKMRFFFTRLYFFTWKIINILDRFSAFTLSSLCFFLGLEEGCSWLVLWTTVCCMMLGYREKKQLWHDIIFKVVLEKQLVVGKQILQTTWWHKCHLRFISSFIIWKKMFQCFIVITSAWLLLYHGRSNDPS